MWTEAVDTECFIGPVEYACRQVAFPAAKVGNGLCLLEPELAVPQLVFGYLALFLFLKNIEGKRNVIRYLVQQFYLLVCKEIQSF